MIEVVTGLITNIGAVIAASLGVLGLLLTVGWDRTRLRRVERLANLAQTLRDGEPKRLVLVLLEEETPYLAIRVLTGPGVLQNVMLVLYLAASAWTLLVIYLVPLRFGLSAEVANDVSFGSLFATGTLWLLTTIEWLRRRARALRRLDLPMANYHTRGYHFSAAVVRGISALEEWGRSFFRHLRRRRR